MQLLSNQPPNFYLLLPLHWNDAVLVFYFTVTGILAVVQYKHSLLSTLLRISTQAGFCPHLLAVVQSDQHPLNVALSLAVQILTLTALVHINLHSIFNNW